MDNKARMIQSLNGLLEDNETLLYPIYGVLTQGNTQHFAYFGFTENNLLIVLLSGKENAYTTRMPLEIKSVKIKQTLILKQYEIDISFQNDPPFRITASPKVLLIDSQKENLPQFLEYLLSKASPNQFPELKHIEGKKIRWQYFNFYIYIMLVFYPMALISIAFSIFEGGGFEPSVFIELLISSLGTWGVFLLPFFLLSFFNRLFFGKILCVLNSDGLHMYNDMIPWSNVQKVIYHPTVWLKHGSKSAYAVFTVKNADQEEHDVEILHFPIYGLRKIKQYHPQLKITFEKSKLLLIALSAVAPSIIAVILSLIM